MRVPDRFRPEILLSAAMTTIWVRPGVIPSMRSMVGEDSSPEVTSSSASPPGVVASVLGGLGSGDIGEVDIDLFDLDLNSYPPRMLVHPHRGHGPASDTSSISGRRFCLLSPPFAKFLPRPSSSGMECLYSGPSGCKSRQQLG